MEGGFEAPAKWNLGEGSGAVGGMVDAVGGERGSRVAGCGGGSGAVARHGGSGSRGADGSRGGGSDAAAPAPWAEIFVPNKKKRKNRKTQMQMGLPSMKLGLRPPAFEELFDEDPSEEEPDDEVDDEKESRDKKSRHVLNQLKQGKWDYQPAVGKYSCPFCNNVKPQDYDWMVAHAIGIGLDGSSRRAHVRAKHAAYGVFLQRLKVD